MPKSNFLRSEILTGKLGTGTITEPANLWLCLYTTDPTAADSGTEVTGGGYARLSTATNGTDWTASDTDTWANAVVMTFVTSSGAWSSGSSITHVGLRDASSGGNLHWYEALTTPRTVAATGVTLSFAIGAITISEA